MMHVVIFPTWRCQLRCPYCWVPHVKIDRAAKERSWQDWASALAVAMKPGSIVDIAGGEPLMFPGLEHLLASLGHRGIGWAISTNALATQTVDRLIDTRPPNCAGVNVSDHPGNERAAGNIRRLRRAFPVRVHRVEHPGAGRHEPDAGTIPYQAWAEGLALDGIRRECTAGENHWAADVAGNIWRCLVEMQLGMPPAANLFEGWQRPVASLCEHGCTTAYSNDGPAWGLVMREDVICVQG